MTSDAQKKTTRNAVIFIDGEPALELNADEFIYWIKTADERHEAYVAMKPYEPYPVKKFYDMILPRSKRRTQAESVIQKTGTDAVCKFVLDHFLYLIGVEDEKGNVPKIEQQIQWLKDNEQFTERIFRNGIDSIAPISQEDIDKKMVLLFDKKNHRIPLELHLYSLEKQSCVTVRMTAVFSRMMQPDKHKYEKAVAVIENSRQGTTFFEANWDAIEQLCNIKLNSLEGAFMDGKPCVEANKEAWIKKMPFIYKIYAIGKAMQDIDIKN